MAEAVAYVETISPHVWLAYKSFGEIYAKLMCDIAHCRVVGEDIGRWGGEEGRGFKKSDVFWGEDGGE